MDIGAFINYHLIHITLKLPNDNVIGIGNIIRTIAKVLNHERKFATLEKHFWLVGSLDFATLGHMTIIDTKGSSYK